MSKMIKIRVTKNGFKLVKIKVLPNENYLIIDEDGKSIDKLKFVQENENLEIYAEKDGLAKKVAILEDFYKPNMNSSIVGLDATTNQEIGYMYNPNDGWSYIGGELPETEIGAVFPFVGLLTTGTVAGTGIVASTNDNRTTTTNVEEEKNIAINIIKDAAENNSATDTTPSMDIYTTAGVTGVNNTNLAAINSVLNTENTTGINGEDVDTTEEIQKIVDSYNKILTEADAIVGNIDKINAPTLTDYTNIGVINIDNSVKSTLLTDSIERLETNKVDSVSEIQVLADAVKTIMSVASGEDVNSTIFMSELVKLGVITQIEVDSLRDTQTLSILETIQSTDDSGEDVDTVVKIKQYLNYALQEKNIAINIIKDAAENNSATDTTPSMDIYTTAGVTGVNNTNLAAINSVLNTENTTGINGEDVDTTEEIQKIVDSYNKILTEADAIVGNIDKINAPTLTDYTNIGVINIDNSVKSTLLTDSIERLETNKVDSVSEIQVLADAVKTIMSVASGEDVNSTIFMSELVKLGVITQIVADSLNSAQHSNILEIIKATNDSGEDVDTVLKIQQLIRDILFDTT